jgi:hypothetical protein
MKVFFKKNVCQERFIEASKCFMEKVGNMKKFKITYILGNDIRIAYAEGRYSNEVLIKFLLKNKSVTDVQKIEEVTE